MPPFEIVAHRGVHDLHPENTLAAFERAIELGADSVELDIRLSADLVPMVFHYFYLDEVTSSSGPIFNYTARELQSVEMTDKENGNPSKISSLSEVLEAVGGRIGLEIEIKGPEMEGAKIIADGLSNYKSIWGSIEVTSYEPVLLREFQKLCRTLPVDLLLPRCEPWMKLDVLTYLAIHRSRLAQARAVHLHPTQLTEEVVSAIQKQGLQVHAWDVNDEQSLNTAVQLGIPKVCTDTFQLARDFRQNLMRAN
jgi:glycerophosphoryl diester phosphodiesterase